LNQKQAVAGAFPATSIRTLQHMKRLMNASTRPLVVVTGASSGIGLELARECAQNGFDLVIAADRDLSDAIEKLSEAGISIEAIPVGLGHP
jgi:short-subunit dehydrogenase